MPSVSSDASSDSAPVSSTPAYEIHERQKERNIVRCLQVYDAWLSSALVSATPAFEIDERETDGEKYIVMPTVSFDGSSGSGTENLI